ncbi:BTAD domain-containing putative transcriptional regulator [Saccharomonospora sp. NPDC046836]|uniref:BTAD domain-containing putative transcriptional regulator n=1 Tax=Saccharomonospora sp. NPDC046836 TaxID=3156921 RepID=UPI00340F6A15
MRIELLGGFAVETGAGRVDSRRWRLRKARILVAALALEAGQRMHRDRILDHLWPDLEPAAAAHNLHQALYVARRAIGETGTRDLLTVRDELVLLHAGGPIEVDVIEFERAAEQALAVDDDELLQAALDRYRGELLPELAYADWLEPRRTALRALHHELLLRQAEHRLAAGAFDEARLQFDTVLGADGLNEVAVRGVMAALAATGRQPAALARYEQLRDDLLESSGADPDTRTRKLFRELLTAEPPAQDRLPVALTSFVGRARELGEVRTLLRRTRLLTLTGPGGCGKTRLAVEAAAAQPDGVWFADLAALAEGRLVPDAIAAAFDLAPGSGPDPTRALIDQLRHRRGLLVLDTCEHLLHACTRTVAALLAGCPGIRILATSREPLRTPGEVTFRVPSLEVPHPGPAGSYDAARLGQFESARLFVERARQVRPEFTLSAANAGAVAEVCRRLDGLPLALELAAARVSLLEPAELVTRLEDALTTLGAGAFGVTRHQTLRAALAWSHDLLDAGEQVLFRRLSVFAGPFTVEAVEVVCGLPPLRRDEVLGVLGRLADKSLVLTDRTARGTRLRLLDTVRQFAAERLRGSAERPVVAAAHCAHYLEVALAHDAGESVTASTENPRLLDADHDNFRAALRWALATDPSTALALATRLWRYWFLRGHAVEGGDWLERALAAAPEPSLLRARALLGLTGLDARRGRGHRLLREGEEAVALVQRLGDPVTVIRYRLVQATLVWATLDVVDAERIAREARERAAELGRTDLRAGGAWLLGMCALARENAAAAGSLLRTCLAELGETDPESPPFLPVVTPCVVPGPIGDRIVPFFEESLLMGRRVGAAQGIGYVLSGLGYTARLERRSRLARAMVCESVDAFALLGDDLGRAHSLNHLGCVLRDAGEYGEAAERLTEARQIRRRLGDHRGELLTSANLGVVRAVSGDIERGRHDVRACLAAAEAIDDRPAASGLLGMLAAIELAAGRLPAARTLYGRAVRRFAHQTWPRIEGWHRLMAAELAADLGDQAGAGLELDRAAVLFGRQHCAVAEARVHALRLVLTGC